MHPRPDRRLTVRRAISTALAALMTATLLNIVAAPAAQAAEGPSVDLPETRSVPVTRQTMSDRDTDQATASALTGDQPAGESPKDGGGTYSATSLSPSSGWNVSAQSGDFSWSYPMRVPPAPGGLEPSLGLSYTSSAVDGKTSGTNPQASWVGDGWDLSVGFIERGYGLCVDDDMGDVTPPEVGDLCWRTDNAVLGYDAGSGQLIKTGEGTWRLESDDGTRIERLTGADNGDDNGEHWKVTTLDGTEYHFGSRPASKSTWTVPVYGDDDGEPCHGSRFADSHCTQAWRWNLDKVVDRHGNTMLYTYRTETNSYGMNRKDDAVSYVRGGTLERIEYGLHADSGAAATGRVLFSVADRCVPGSACTQEKPDNWPDVPWDWHCDEPTCEDYSPSFWSTKRLAKVTTQVRSGTKYTDVDSWTLEHLFPDPGDGEKATLWLKGVTHTGHVDDTLTGRVDDTLTMPQVTFEGTMKSNRVWGEDGLAPLNRYRLTGVVSESGGVLTITYAEPDCSIGDLPAAPERNAKRCFPVTWAKRDHEERTDYFHKYVVEAVSEYDRLSTSPSQVTQYEYLGGAAWHYNRSEFTDPDDKTWDEFRGFGKVRVFTGTDDDLSGPRTMTERRFYRGMNGDRLPDGGDADDRPDKRTVSFADSEGGRRVDHDWLRGFEYETVLYDGVDGEVVSKTITMPVWQGPTAERGDLKAYIVGTGSTDGYTALGDGAWTSTRTEHEYDEYGLLTQTNDLGDTATADDDRCTTVDYARDSGRGMIAFVSQTQTVAADCGTTASLRDDLITSTRNLYDGGDFGDAPTTGDVTARQVAHEFAGSEPAYLTVASTEYDRHGRAIEVTDALGRSTTTAYTPATGGPVTGVATTGPPVGGTSTTEPKGLTETVRLNPALGLPVATTDPNGRRTEATIDPLGRVTEVWLPNRNRSTQSGNARYEYLVRNDRPSAVTTHSLNPQGDYVTSVVIYDGLLRARQTQTPADGGGRLLTDTRYDSHGRPWKTTSAYYNDASVDEELWIATTDGEIPSRTETRFDGAGRSIARIQYTGLTELWRTTTAYEGDRVHVTPPEGGTATTQISDARGQTTELRQYHGDAPSGEFDAVAYTYSDAGKLATVTDPAGNRWSYEYDLLGRQIRVDDPDQGETALTYDDAGQLVSTTDARGVRLDYRYDALGRRTQTLHGEEVLAEWTYDTVPLGKGKAATATRYVDGAAYTTTVRAYDAMYRPLATQLTIPEAEETLAGTYTSYAKFNPDGSPMSTTMPAIGDLPRETLSWEYDGLGKPKAMSGGLSGTTQTYVAQTEYTRYGELARTHLGTAENRVWQSFYYDTGTRRLSRMIVDAAVPRPMIADVRYEYNDAGNLVSIADTPIDKPADVQCFRYDHLQRLTDAWTPEADCDGDPAEDALAGAAPYRQSFTYDAVGNRLTESHVTPSGRTDRSYAYPEEGEGPAHALQALTEEGPDGTEEYAFAYDEAGNTVTRSLPEAEQSLEWDAENHLEKVTVDGETTEFVYDAEGDRLIKRDPTGSTLYLGGQELRLDAETGELTATRYYKYGDRTVAMREADTGLTWLAGDHQDTSQIAVSGKDLTVEQHRQLPFGQTRGESADIAGDRGFVGGTEDESIGLVHLGAREYDPLIGRFISVDPVMDLADSQQMHGYTYGNNNPIANADPTGLLPEWVADGAAVGGIVLGGLAIMATAGGASLAVIGGLTAGAAAMSAVSAAHNCPAGNTVSCVVDVTGAALVPVRLAGGGIKLLALKGSAKAHGMVDDIAQAAGGALDDLAAGMAKWNPKYLPGRPLKPFTSLVPNGGGIRAGTSARAGAAQQKYADHASITPLEYLAAPIFGASYQAWETTFNKAALGYNICTTPYGPECTFSVPGLPPVVKVEGNLPAPWAPQKTVVIHDVRWDPRTTFMPKDVVYHTPPDGSGSGGVRPVGVPDSSGNYKNGEHRLCNTGSRVCAH